MLLLLMLQTAASPDIEIQARVRAKSVTVEQKGTASLQVHADPDGGSATVVNAPRGSTTYRDVNISVDGKAVLAPAAPAPGAAPDLNANRENAQ